MIRQLHKQDKHDFITMVKEFYTSKAVLEDISEEHILITYNTILQGSPYVQGFIIESAKEMAGYGLICITYSNEAGGLVVWIEELYIRQKFRGAGLGSQFLAFVEATFAAEAKQFRLELTYNNKSAERLYKSVGFSTLDYKQMTLTVD